jgi:hypothetical protein
MCRVVTGYLVACRAMARASRWRVHLCGCVDGSVVRLLEAALLAVSDWSRRKALTDWNCVMEGRVGPLVFEGWNVPDIREMSPSGDYSVLVARTKHYRQWDRRPIPSYPVFWTKCHQFLTCYGWAVSRSKEYSRSRGFGGGPRTSRVLVRCKALTKKRDVVSKRSSCAL